LELTAAGRFQPFYPPAGTARILGNNCRQAQQSRGCVSGIEREGRTIWIIDAHRDNGKRFVVRSDELLTAFLELERITHDLAVSALLGDDSH
jgi:hypothetical protein